MITAAELKRKDAVFSELYISPVLSSIRVSFDFFGRYILLTNPVFLYCFQ